MRGAATGYTNAEVLRGMGLDPAMDPRALLEADDVSSTHSVDEITDQIVADDDADGDEGWAAAGNTAAAAAHLASKQPPTGGGGARSAPPPPTATRFNLPPAPGGAGNADVRTIRVP